MKLFIVLFFCLFVRVAAQAGSDEVAPVSTYKVQEQTLEEKISIIGDVHAFNTVLVYSKVVGTIEKLDVEVGKDIPKDAVIAEIEHLSEIAQRKEIIVALELAQIAIKQAHANLNIAQAKCNQAKAVVQQAKTAVKVAQANLNQAKAVLDNATEEKKRGVSLLQEKSIPQQRYDQIITAHKQAQASYDLANAQHEASQVQIKIAQCDETLAETNIVAAEIAVEQAKAQLKNVQASLERLDVRIAEYTIHAPIPGIVTMRMMDSGAMNSPQQPIVQIAQIDKVKIIFHIPEIQYNKIRPEIPAVIRVDACPDRQFAGSISLITPIIDLQTRTQKVEIYLENKDYLLKPGMLARITLLVGTYKALAIPKDCLLRMPATGINYAYVIKDGIAQKVSNIKTGMRQENFVEILDGLQKGDEIVFSGHGRLRGGQKVKVIKDTSENK